jgi:hypothetical protein
MSWTQTFPTCAIPLLVSWTKQSQSVTWLVTPLATSGMYNFMFFLTTTDARSLIGKQVRSFKNPPSCHDHTLCRPLSFHFPSGTVLIPSQRYCLVDKQPIIAGVMRNPSLAQLYDLSILSRVINNDIHGCFVWQYVDTAWDRWIPPSSLVIR